MNNNFSKLNNKLCNKYTKSNNTDNTYLTKQEIPDDFPIGLLPLSLIKYHLMVKAEAQKRREEKKQKMNKLILFQYKLMKLLNEQNK